MWVKEWVGAWYAGVSPAVFPYSLQYGLPQAAGGTPAYQLVYRALPTQNLAEPKFLMLLGMSKKGEKPTKAFSFSCGIFLDYGDGSGDPLFGSWGRFYHGSWGRFSWSTFCSVDSPITDACDFGQLP